jgi:hypothetical protein
MRNKYWGTLLLTALLLLGASIGSAAQDRGCERLSGTINAYSPQTGAIGPYEIRGHWSLNLHPYSGRADFHAALNMELLDGWVITQNGGNFDPAARGAHTHHITMREATVTWTATGFQLNGQATVTLNGGPAPVSPTPLQIDVTGGADVKYSNITLTFGVPGSKHFGTEPLAGVVARVERDR